MRRDYLSRLSRAARWYLPPAEAAEVLEDYREIVAGRSEEELRRGLDAPSGNAPAGPAEGLPPVAGGIWDTIGLLTFAYGGCG